MGSAAAKREPDTRYAVIKRRCGNDFVRLPPSGREGDHEVVEGARGHRRKATSLAKYDETILSCGSSRLQKYHGRITSRAALPRARDSPAHLRRKKTPLRRRGRMRTSPAEATEEATTLGRKYPAYAEPKLQRGRRVRMGECHSQKRTRHAGVGFSFGCGTRIRT